MGKPASAGVGARFSAHCVKSVTPAWQRVGIAGTRPARGGFSKLRLGNNRMRRQARNRTPNNFALCVWSAQDPYVPWL